MPRVACAGGSFVGWVNRLSRVEMPPAISSRPGQKVPHLDLIVLWKKDLAIAAQKRQRLFLVSE